MSTRDEWARMNPSDYSSKSSAYAGGYQAGRDALIAEGWRKMPSRDELVDLLYADFSVFEQSGSAYVFMRATMAADAILALMDGGK